MEAIITPQTKMYEILDQFPSARRLLFQKFHIGGCSSCGYSLDETLEEVFTKHNKKNQMEEAIKLLYESAEFEKKIQLSVYQLKELIEKKEHFLLLDVREPFERDIVSIEDSILLTRDLAFEILQKGDKNQKMIFYCHTGIRSLEAAIYFYHHGFKNVFNLKGGIDEWVREIEPHLPRY